MSFTLSLFAAVTVQKNVRDLALADAWRKPAEPPVSTGSSWGCRTGARRRPVHDRRADQRPIRSKLVRGVTSTSSGRWQMTESLPEWVPAGST